MREIFEWLDGIDFLTALSEWFCCVCYISQVKRKRHGIHLYLICIIMFILMSGVLYLTSNYKWIENDFLWIWFKIPIYCSIMWSFLYLCCKGSKLYITCIFVKAFLCAEFIWSLILDFRHSWFELGIFRWMVNIGIFFLIFKIIHKMEKLFSIKEQDEVTIQETAGYFGIALASFGCSTIFFGIFSSVFTQWLNISHTASALIGVFLVFEYQMWIVNRKIQQELVLIGKVMEDQKKQYHNLQENIEVINQKYHDMKHMCFLIRSGSAQNDMKWVNEIENEIRDFEAREKTENDILDTILTNKQLYCIHHKIELTCVIDGKKLNDMREIDICTIFGNALDNAIESVEQIEDKEKRLIHISVFEKQGFLNINFDNILGQEIKFLDGLPQTTKGKEKGHGYGLKSIRYTVERYDGYMEIRTDENWFELKLLLPLPLKWKES